MAEIETRPVFDNAEEVCLVNIAGASWLMGGGAVGGIACAKCDFSARTRQGARDVCSDSGKRNCVL